MDKVWLVTGSASGLGRNVAEAVLESGESTSRHYAANVAYFDGMDTGSTTHRRMNAANR